MLTAAALVKDETDLVTGDGVDTVFEMVLGLGGRPDAVTARSQTIFLTSIHGL